MGPVRFGRFLGFVLSAIGLPVSPAVIAAQSVQEASAGSPVSGVGYSASRARPASSTIPAGAPVTITIEGGARRMLVGATVPHTARVRDASGAERRDVAVQWSSSDPNVASVNQYGVLTAVRPGPVTIRAVAGALSADRRYVVEANTIKSLTLSITADQVKTGDVVEVSAMAFDSNGYKVPNVPFLYTFTAAVDDSVVGQMAPAELDQKGRFVAQQAGDYQIIAVAPGLVAHRTIRVSNRDVVATSRVVARAPVPGAQLVGATSWRGRDGRDFVLACGMRTRGEVVTYELSDAALRALDTVSVDAKAITACTVDTETALAAVVRDVGAGRSAIALLDVSEPRTVKALGSIEDGLGAVSGVAFYKRHVLAVSDAHRLDVVSVEDPTRPRRVASLDLAEHASIPSASPATDVSVTDGVAYVALDRMGVAIVDVGNGKFGGSVGKPMRIAGFHAPLASTHAAYGYRSRTGKWYVIMSDNLLSADGGAPDSQTGFARIVDFTDSAHPEEVARYEVPEAGVQDVWVDGDRLYVAAQNGGIRVVDISADLKGSLYHQGREVARFLPSDGHTAPNVVAVQPIRGGALAGDRSSGVWVVKLSTKD